MFNVTQQAQQHALDDYPKESVGIVVDDKYIRLDNIHHQPNKHFKVDESSYLPYLQAGTLQAVIHSHPDGHLSPSESDMIQQMAMALPWGIVRVRNNFASKVLWFGDQCPIAPLKERKFVHGVADCYALLRDTYRLELDITIKQYPRDRDWWSKGGNLLADNFKDCGWSRVDRSELEPYDVVLMQIKSDVVNHTAICRENGLILHHLYGRASRDEPLQAWISSATHFLRYTG